MLTTNPAILLGVQSTLGSIEPDQIANLVVTDKPLLDEDANILDVWIDGNRHEVTKPPPAGLEGRCRENELSRRNRATDCDSTNSQTGETPATNCSLCVSTQR